MKAIPEFDEQVDDNDAICPYCGWRYQVESEDFSEDCSQQQCDDCGKKFWVSQEFSVTTISRPDCKLNGQEHQYELVTLKNGKQAYFCKVCDDCTLEV